MTSGRRRRGDPGWWTVAGAATVASLAGASFRRTLRERAVLFWTVAFPMAVVLIIGLGFSGGPRLRVAIPRGVEGPGREVLAGLRTEVDITEVRDAERVRGMVADGTVDAGLTFSGTAPVVIGVLTARSDVAAVMRPMVDAVVGLVDARLRAASALVEVGAEASVARSAVDALRERVQPVVVHTEPVPSPFAGLGRFGLVATQQLVLFTFLNSLILASAVLRDRQTGVLARIATTPVPVPVTVAGLGAGRFLVALGQAAVVVTGTALLFGVRWGAPAGVGAVLVAFSAVAAAAAVLVGTLARTDQQVALIGVLGGLGLAALGGCMVPLGVMPPGLRTIAHLTPHAWAIDALTGLVRGASPGAVIPEVLVLVVTALGLWAVATLRLTRSSRTA